MKNLNSEEKFICEIIWGGIPVDETWIRNSKLFKEGLDKFLREELYNDLFLKEKQNDKSKQR